MKFTIERERLLRPLQAVQGVVERRQTLPILSNVLLGLREGRLSVTATDMELELVASVELSEGEGGETTVPARKLIDICRSLPGEAAVQLAQEDDRVILRSGRSRFTLATLPAGEFPAADAPADGCTVPLTQGHLKRLIELTHFAMAHQDVRYYLNGLLLEIGRNSVRAVATDGHRLAVADWTSEEPLVEEGAERAVILPRKAVGELQRLLDSGDEALSLVVGSNAILVELENLRFTTKLIDGRFPEYGRVIPDAEACDKQLLVDRDVLKAALGRAAILSNDKYRAIRLSLEPGNLKVAASNPEQEEAEDSVEVEYGGSALEIGFNVTYLTDALAAVPTGNARLFLSDASSSCLITPEGSDDCRFVVMPMRL